MAEQTTNLSYVSCTYVDHATPSTAYNYPTEYDHYYSIDNRYSGRETMLLINFAQLPSNLKRKKLLYAHMVMQTYERVIAVPLMGTFTRNVTTWNTMPETYPNATNKDLYIVGRAGLTWHDVEYEAYSSITDEKRAEFASLVLKYSSLAITGGPGAVQDVLLDGTSRPYLIIAYDNAVSLTSKVVYRSGPTSGYNNPRNATSFSWDYEKTASDIYAADETFTQASATLYWKKSTDSSYTAVNVSGDTKSVTISANTFPTNSTIEWYIRGTDTDGTTSQTEVYSFSTVAGTAYATPISPISSVEDGSSPITFRWTLSSTDGQAPTGVSFAWYKTGEAEWQYPFSNISPRTSYTFPGGTFPAGEIQWSVKAFNADGVAGPWSSANPGYHKFICVSAPAAVTGLNATQVPLTTISWQSDEQQGYMITIDGEVVKKAFGSDVYSWTVEEPLTEGNHEIGVSVQGVYGLWSAVSTVTVSCGGPSDTITLVGVFDIDGTFEVENETGTIRYYRDDEYIGSASGDELFTDSRALGTHKYFARKFLSDGNYKQSNTVTGTMTVESKMIAPLDGSSGWLQLRLSENSMDVEDYRLQQEQVLQHIKGAVWPHGERSRFRDKSATYNCAFVTAEEASAFEALFGKPVILKSKGDEVVIGSLNQVQKRVNVFYTSYNFTIQQMYTSEIIR